jgi:hypothetical protein
LKLGMGTLDRGFFLECFAFRHIEGNFCARHLLFFVCFLRFFFLRMERILKFLDLAIALQRAEDSGDGDE